MSNPETCFTCGDRMHLVRERALLHMGARSATIEVQRLRCDGCGEIFYTPEQADAAQQSLASELRAQENLLSPEEIRAFRDKHRLTQVELEQLLGVGAKTVVRWERGTIFQSRAIDELLRVIDAVPAAYEFLARKNGVAVATTVGADVEARPQPTVRFQMPREGDRSKPRAKVVRMKDFARGREDKSLRLDEPGMNELPEIPVEALK